MISASGTLFFPFGANAPVSQIETWLSARPAGSPDAIADTGAVTATLTPLSAAPLLSQGLLYGGFTLAPTTGGTIRAQFELRRTGAPRPSCASSACDSGLVCDTRVHLCLPPQAPSASATQGSNTLLPQHYEDWRKALTNWYSNTIDDAAMTTPYRSPFNLTLPGLAGTPLFDSPDVGKLSRVAELGLNICVRDLPLPQNARDFSYAYRTIPPVGRPSCTPDYISGNPVDASVRYSVCDGIYHQQSRFPNGCLPAIDPATLARDYLPCLYDPSGKFGHAQYSCQNLYDEQYHGAANPGFASFLQNTCVPSSVSLFGPTEEVEIYMCPAAWRLVFGGTLRNAELTACFDPTANTGLTAPLASSTFTSTVVKSSGDLRCASSKTLTEVPLVDVERNVDPAASPSPTAPTASELYRICMTELRRPVPADNPGGVRASIGDALAAAQCINLGAFVGSLETARRVDPSYFVDLLRRWAALHSFIAEQGRVDWESARVLSSIDSSRAAEGQEQILLGLLDQLDRGFDLLLSPTIGASLASLGPADLSADYRNVYHPQGVLAEHEQNTNLSIALYQALGRYLEVVQTLIEQTAIDSYTACRVDPTSANAELRERLGAALRYAAAVEQLTASIEARETDATRALKARDARHEFRAIQARVIGAIAALGSCKNPLGLNDDELPLFFGDAQGSNGRFFASSDYLLGLTTPEITTASQALDQARLAWDQARQSRIQTAATANQFDQRVDDLKTRYGAPVVEACGLTIDGRLVLDAFDPSKPTALKVETCHLKPGCSPTSTDATCFRGSIGEAILTIRGAREDVENARRAWKDAQESYETQFEYCKGLQADLAQDTALADSHASEMASLRQGKQIVDTVDAVLDGVTACASSEFGAGCPSAIGGSILKGISLDMQRQMDDAEGQYQAERTRLANAREAKACFHEADMRRIGIQTAFMQIQRRLTDSDEAMLKLANLRDHVRQQLVEGAAAVARETGRRLPSVAFHYWYKDKVVEFARKFDRAKKLTFLALEAVEYEHQISLDLRSKIVGAVTPTDLDAARVELDNYHQTRTLHGARPEAASLVVSVRDELLGLGYDRSSGAAITDTNMRLRDRLLSPASAYYDSNGHYLGQAIPFSLTPDHSDLVHQQGERLWSVGGTIAGDSLSAQPGGRVLLLKRNTFYSRWYPGAGDGSAYQVGRVRPSGYLFGDDPAIANGTGNDPQAFAAASLAPLFNVSRTVLYDDGKASKPLAGSSDALAGRGLYGDYVLLFPAQDPSDPKYVDLSQIEDVLLRFDYYSVTVVPN
jgi:hypothetical protein